MVVKLIAKDKNENFQFQGRCKLVIDFVSKLLLVEPFNEDFKMISALFKWKFVAQKNILFIFAEYDFQDFALVFENTRKCNKVIQTLHKNRVTAGNKELVCTRFLPPLFNEVSKNDGSIKEILLKWVEFHDGKEKEELTKFLKNYNIFDLMYLCDSSRKNLRQRKAENRNYSKDNENVTHVNSNELINKTTKRQSFKATATGFVQAPNFEIFKYVKNGNAETRLYVFPTSNREYSYDYFCCKSRGYYMCSGCWMKKHRTTAKIVKKNAQDVVRLNNIQHVCELKKRKEIVEKPNFQIFTFENKRAVVKRLIIFLDLSHTKCYEYRLIKTLYYCSGCFRKNHFTTANICQKEEDGTEFVMLNSNDHVCEIQKYDAEKYIEKETLEAENFKVFEEFRNGKNKSKLVIFASLDKKTYYEYLWKESKNCFMCLGCRNLQKHVFARVCQNADQGDYVMLYKKQHVCKPTEYDAEKFDISKNEVVESSNFKIFEYKHHGKFTSKLIVFCDTNKNLCYEYFKMHDAFYCSSGKSGNKPNAVLCQNENSKNCVILSKEKHVCDLIEYNAEKYKDDAIIEKSMYNITTTYLRNVKEKILIIFTTKEQKFYYKFVYNCFKKYYYCPQCNASKIYITATIQNEEKENEFVFVSYQKHVCKPFTYSEVIYGNIIIYPNFQLLKRKVKGKIIQHMVVFTNGKKAECYEYTWSNKENCYLCQTCANHHRTHVYAKMVKNNKNEEFFELSPKQHKCKPIKFVPENLNGNIIKHPDFKLWEDNYKKQKITVYNSNDRNFGNIYIYNAGTKNYVCIKCRIQKKHVTAKLLQVENKRSYLELSNAEHVCELQKL